MKPFSATLQEDLVKRIAELEAELAKRYSDEFVNNLLRQRDRLEAERDALQQRVKDLESRLSATKSRLEWWRGEALDD